MSNYTNAVRITIDKVKNAKPCCRVYVLESCYDIYSAMNYNYNISYLQEIRDGLKDFDDVVEYCNIEIGLETELLT